MDAAGLHQISLGSRLDGLPRKWQGAMQWQRLPEESAAVLMDRQPTYAAAEMPQEEFTFLLVEVPSLPAAAFDPLSLVDETADAVEASMASLNGQAGAVLGVYPCVWAWISLLSRRLKGHFASRSS